MKTLIVAATNSEITSETIKSLPNLITGVGMVNTAINLTKELVENEYDIVVNIGVSGSFSSDILIGDVVEVVEDSFSEIGFENGVSFSEFSELNVKTSYEINGKTTLRKVKSITVNTVHGNEKSIDEIVKTLNPDIESMEGAAVFQVCKKFKIPCVQIRSISNKVEIRNKENWNLELAISNLNKEVEKIILTL
ncbi:MAG: futalosine hydrolase [Flavobacteriales bacterium]|jgi:futalosine hydrolase|nr:futalosine hydrolase [Flavobacteriales bacterium]